MFDSGMNVRVTKTQMASTATSRKAKRAAAVVKRAEQEGEATFWCMVEMEETKLERKGIELGKSSIARLRDPALLGEGHPLVVRLMRRLAVAYDKIGMIWLHALLLH